MALGPLQTLPRRIPAGCALLLAAAAAVAQERPLSTAHDGQWTAVIVCDDFRSEKGTLAKGYTVTVPPVITGGRVEGQRERATATAGDLRYVGEVREGGELLIQALGATGKPDYTPNRVAPGTQFGYTLQGRLTDTGGSAVRQELRPCKASFTRTP